MCTGCSMFNCTLASGFYHSFDIFERQLNHTTFFMVTSACVVLPSQDGWQHPVKSGAEELEENPVLQLCQTFKVWSTSCGVSLVSKWQNSRLMAQLFSGSCPACPYRVVSVYGSRRLACAASNCWQVLRNFPLWQLLHWLTRSFVKLRIDTKSAFTFPIIYP